MTFKTLIFCFLLVGFSAPSHISTAVLSGIKQDNQAITQDATPREPKKAHLVVEGPTEIGCGNLVVISVEGSDASSFKWIVTPSNDNHLVIEGGKRIVFSSGTCGTYTFIVACSLGDTCDLAVHTLTVTGNEKPSVNSLTSQIALWCTDVNSLTKQQDALALAASFSRVASQMEDGDLESAVDMVAATSKSNKEALGENITKWEPFRNGLREHLRKMSNEGKLSDTASHVQTWNNIAIALREYSSSL